MNMKTPRLLTHDERKASEAAFRGLPLDDNWTDSAKLVYKGIILALGKDSSGLQVSVDDSKPSLPQPSLLEGPDPSSSQNTPEMLASDSLTAQEIPGEVESLTLRSPTRSCGIWDCKDVTPLAQSIGLEFSVGMTNPLWEQYITSSPDLTEEIIHTRVRDTLVAVRLRLASLKVPVPLVDVPVLLEFDPEPTPQLCLTFALFHKDSVEGIASC